jgi:hypothetical protein
MGVFNVKKGKGLSFEKHLYQEQDPNKKNKTNQYFIVSFIKCSV